MDFSNLERGVPLLVQWFAYLETLPQAGLINFCIIAGCLCFCAGQLARFFEHRKRARGMLTYEEFLEKLHLAP